LFVLKSILLFATAAAIFYDVYLQMDGNNIVGSLRGGMVYYKKDRQKEAGREEKGKDADF
jgi:hypothetical protein